MTNKDDVSDIFMNFRECVRHLWNIYYRNLDDGWHSFINVEREIYETLVLNQIFTENDYSNENEDIIIIPQSKKDELEVLWNDKSNVNQNNYISIRIVPSQINLVYVDFFDWNENGYRDYRYIRCNIVHYEADPKLNNTELLIEVENAVIKLKKVD